jgi:hypothetical protein
VTVHIKGEDCCTGEVWCLTFRKNKDQLEVDLPGLHPDNTRAF